MAGFGSRSRLTSRDPEPVPSGPVGAGEVATGRGWKQKTSDEKESIMKTHLRALVALLALVLVAGCGDDGDTIIGSPGGILNINDNFPASSIFANQTWPQGGAYSPTGNPAFDIPGNGAPQQTGVPVRSSIPGNGSVLPRPWDQIKFVAFATYALLLDHINAITGGINNGLPTQLGDLVVLPSYATGMPENERYRLFQINTEENMVPLTRSTEPGRTQVIGIAFRNGTGGYVPAEPYTDDTFRGALVYMKATKHPLYGVWTMQQKDWRSGTGVDYATSLRLMIRGNSAVAVIREAELDAIAATEFRWDTFSYTTDENTDWSHDFTDWIAIP
jgi:hypothetical protein